jgi:mannose-6-phosphate isomerase-like protein (cupin superfamily)
MRSTVEVCVVLALALGTVAQPTTAQNQASAVRTFTSADEVRALIAKAKTDRRSDQASFVQPMLRLAPYTANLEYRVAGLNANASVHEREAEIFFVVEGSGTLVTGGKLRDEKRLNAGNLSGPSIEGGTSRAIAKGDVMVVPENTPPWFGNVVDTLVLISMRVPRGGTAESGR